MSTTNRIIDEKFCEPTLTQKEATKIKTSREHSATLPENFCSSFLVTFVELFDSAARFDVALTTREERMAFRADVHAQFFFRGAGFESIATTASDRRFKVLRMNFFLHA